MFAVFNGKERLTEGRVNVKNCLLDAIKIGAIEQHPEGIRWKEGYDVVQYVEVHTEISEDTIPLENQKTPS